VEHNKENRNKKAKKYTKELTDAVIKTYLKTIAKRKNETIVITDEMIINKRNSILMLRLKKYVVKEVINKELICTCNAYGRCLKCENERRNKKAKAYYQRNKKICNTKAKIRYKNNSNAINDAYLKVLISSGNKIKSLDVTDEMISIKKYIIKTKRFKKEINNEFTSR